MGYQLSINVTYVGDTNDGRCGDYVIVSMICEKSKKQSQ